MPLALWLARPEWRALPIQVLAVDNAVQPMELGRDVMAAWGDILGQPVWQVRVERGSLEHMPRLERKLADTLERQERHLRPYLEQLVIDGTARLEVKNDTIYFYLNE